MSREVSRPTEPSSPTSTQLSSAELSLTSSATSTGLSGGVASTASVVAETLSESEELEASSATRSAKQYAVPAVRPVTVADSAVPATCGAEVTTSVPEAKLADVMGQAPERSS